MLSRMSLKWKRYDWVLVLFIAIVILTLMQVLMPNTGLAHALHQGFHALAIGVAWIGNGLLA